MLLRNHPRGFRSLLVTMLLFCQILPSAIRAHEEGEVHLRITIVKGQIVDVATVSGRPALALASAREIKTYWRFGPAISGVYDVFISENTKLDPAAAHIRIIVKEGRVIEATAVGASPAEAAAAVDLVKKKWQFTANTNLIAVLPFTVQKAR